MRGDVGKRRCSRWESGCGVRLGKWAGYLAANAAKIHPAPTLFLYAPKTSLQGFSLDK